MRKLAITLAIMACFLAADVYVAHLIEPQAKTPVEAVKKLSADILARGLAIGMRYKEKLPKQVDKMTRLEDITAERNMVIYHLSITADGAVFNNIMHEIRSHMNRASCQREDYRKMLAYGLGIAISYRSPSGQHDVPVMITPQMCGII